MLKITGGKQLFIYIVIKYVFKIQLNKMILLQYLMIRVLKILSLAKLQLPR
jgi:hypothetical protein